LIEPARVWHLADIGILANVRLAAESDAVASHPSCK
jgi:hypothetical protein